MVRYRGRSSTAKILKRKFIKDHFLSEAHGRPIYGSMYITEEMTPMGLRDRVVKFKWEDPEPLLESADIFMPDGAVDYASDEFTGDWLDENGNILKTVKCGTPGRAHEIVSVVINHVPARRAIG